MADSSQVARFMRIQAKLRLGYFPLPLDEVSVGKIVPMRENKPMHREQVIATLRAHEPELKQAGVVRLSLFGSTVRGDHRPDSDIDLLAAFDENRRISLLDVIHIENQIADLLGEPVKPQQVQRYEATEYESASFARILKVVRALGLTMPRSVRLVRNG
jgi:hypothetical protein